ncbi:MAG: hypothetical protein BGO69_16330 [Bacteroidetes bacterium 46-16]|nr:MAG: hypothetical protein BGO69_16330 [Bacteroidetes bacterium 46-16]
MLPRVHKISVLLYLSSLVLLVCWGISLKELLMEQVIVATLFISAILWLITGYKKLGKATKIYLFFYPSYLLLATLLFFTERIMFVVLLIPFWTFILPQSWLCEAATGMRNGLICISFRTTVAVSEYQLK